MNFLRIVPTGLSFSMILNTAHIAEVREDGSGTIIVMANGNRYMTGQSLRDIERELIELS